MEVTASNFDGHLPSMVEAIQGCDFAAIDCEFTGLDLNGRRREEYYDDLEQRYARVRTSAHHFLVIQVGLSMFEWQSAEQKYKARTYNCYVFPRPHGALDLRFTCQASSLDFLSKHNFDFNKFVYQGVPFLNLAATDHEYAKLNQQAAPPSQPLTAAAPSVDAPSRTGRDIREALRSEEDKQRHQAIIERVKEWLSASQGGHRSSLKGGEDLRSGGQTADGLTESPAEQVPAQAEGSAGRPQGDISLDGTEALGSGGDSADVLVFEPMNSFWRAVVYQTMEREFGKEHFIVEKVPQPMAGNFESLRLVRSTREAVLAAERARLAEKRARLDRAVGFSQVLRALSHARTPIVGHNMLLDLAYLFHLFVQPLPPTLQAFRQLVGSFFPGGIFDTKHLALQVPEAFPPFAGTSLDAVFKNFCAKVEYPRPSTDMQTPGGQEHIRTAAVPDAAAMGMPMAAEVLEAEAANTSPQPVEDSLKFYAVEPSHPGDAAACAVVKNLFEGATASPKHAGSNHRLAAASNETGRSELGGCSQLFAEDPKKSLGAADAMPSVEHAEGFTRYSVTEDGPPEFGHEAGFDAFMTGVAFVGLAKVLEARRDKPELVAHHLFRQSAALSQSRVARRPPLWSGPVRQSGEGVGGPKDESAVKSTKEAGVDPNVTSSTRAADGKETDGCVALLVLPPAGAVPGASFPVEPESGDMSLPFRVLESQRAPAANQDPTDSTAAASTIATPPLDGAETDELDERALRKLLERISSAAVNMEAVRSFAYRVNLMGSDMPHLPLQGPLIIPERGHVFHVSGFSEETRTPEIAGRFAALGLGYVDISWIDRTSAFVALRSRTLADQVIDSVMESGWEVEVVRWADFCLQAQGQSQEHRYWQTDGLAQARKGTSNSDGTSRLRKGRRLLDGERQIAAVHDMDSERDGRRDRKSMASKTCAIL